eukprot:CAMPEP_0179883846 /NCGR_PEP_ID=MMETSP0982-20121206/28965_1 /TAXON_ID=483367 /ORGANISM="non described non described, Strain CCMP 2436" /LENGTH=116 /DNA_ID=CAMNT_0021778387 /DNA_START=17 /DNA_END=368 /DNA_ORIENTATION=-
MSLPRTGRGLARASDSAAPPPAWEVVTEAGVVVVLALWDGCAPAHASLRHPSCPQADGWAASRRGEARRAERAARPPAAAARPGLQLQLQALLDRSRVGAACCAAARWATRLASAK